MVMLAIIIGITTPKNAINLLRPLLFKNPFVQTTNTKVLTQSCKQPARTLEPVNKSVKFAIKKNRRPMIPEIVIQREFLSLIITSPDLFYPNYGTIL
jgi:hypothetical protein